MSSPVQTPNATPLPLESVKIKDGEIVFDQPENTEDALEIGCFLLKAPEAFDPQPGIDLCMHFHESITDNVTDPLNELRGFREKGQYCFDRENFQVEQLLIESRDLRKHFPEAVIKTYDVMHQVSMITLRWVFGVLSIPEELWGQASGNAVFDSGTHWFAASRYSSSGSNIGCAPHKDTGFVTVLFVNEEGLEVKSGSDWRPVEVKEGYFVVNFGIGMETLTRQMETKVGAPMHRVANVRPKNGRDTRISFAAFASSPAGGKLFELRNDGTLSEFHQVDPLLKAHDKATWFSGGNTEGWRNTNPISEDTE